MQPGRLRAPLPVDYLFRILLPVHRSPVGPGLRGTTVEEPCGQQGRRLVGRSRFLQEVAGGALAEPGGEPFGQPVAPGELGEGGDDARVQPGGPAPHPPGRKRDAGEQPVPARVGETDLFLGDDPQPVVDRLGARRRGGSDTTLHLCGMATTAAQQQPGDPADEAARQPQDLAQRPANGCCGIGDRAVQPAYEPPGRGYVGVGGGAGAGYDRGEHRP